MVAFGDLRLWREMHWRPGMVAHPQRPLLRRQLVSLTLRLKLTLSMRPIAEGVLLRRATPTERNRRTTVQIEDVSSGVADLKVCALNAERAIISNRNLYLFVTHSVSPY